MLAGKAPSEAVGIAPECEEMRRVPEGDGFAFDGALFAHTGPAAAVVLFPGEVARMAAESKVARDMAELVGDAAFDYAARGGAKRGVHADGVAVML